MKAIAVLAVLMLAGIAVSAYRQFTVPYCADREYQAAEGLYQRGDFERARAKALHALEWNPRHAPALALKIEIDFILGEGKPIPASEGYDRYMTSGKLIEPTLAMMDQALARGEARRVLEMAKWVPDDPRVQERVFRAKARLAPCVSGRAASAGSASPAAPSRPTSP